MYTMNKILILAVCYLFMFCQKNDEKNYETFYEYHAVESVYLTFAGDTSVVFKPSTVPPYDDTIWIDVPKHYPVNSGEPIDLTQMNLHVGLYPNVRFVSEVDPSDVIDMSRPYKIDVVNEEGSVKSVYISFKYKSGFEISKGVNITYLFYMPKFDGDDRRQYFNEDDVRLIADLGFDHIRLAVEEIEFWNSKGEIMKSSSELLHDIIRWCQKHDLRVIFDLHSTRNHVHTNRENDLFTDPDGVDYFIRLWMDLSDELSHYPNELLAYELLNEPASSEPLMWNQVAAKTIKAIREREPERTIIVDPCHVTNDRYTKVMYSSLDLPRNDGNVWMTLHFYDPFLLTGYGFESTTYGRRDIPIQYPGRLVPDEYISELPPVWQSTGRSEYDRAELKKFFIEPMNKAKELGVPIFLGEFGSLNTLPKKARENWYRDVIDICNEYRIAHTHFDYKGGGYSLIGMNMEVLYPELVKILTASE